MNKLRRKALFKIVQRLHRLLACINMNNIDEIIVEIGEIVDEIQIILDEEETVLDNIPENLQSGYRYAESEEACDNLYDAIGELEDVDDEYSQEEVEDCVSSAIESLNNCI